MRVYWTVFVEMLNVIIQLLVLKYILLCFEWGLNL